MKISKNFKVLEEYSTPVLELVADSELSVLCNSFGEPGDAGAVLPEGNEWDF